MRGPDLEDAAVGDHDHQPVLLRLEIPTDLLGPSPEVVEVLLIRIMAVGLVGDRHGGMLNRPRPRILEPQTLQLAGDVDLPQQRGMVADLGVVGRQIHPARPLSDRDHLRGPSYLSNRGGGAARPQVAAADDKIDGQEGEALGEAVGVLGAERGERVGVVLVAGLEGVGRIGFALAVTDHDELLIAGHADARCTAARMNSSVTSTSTVSAWLRRCRSRRCSAWSTAWTSWAVTRDSSATPSG